jgi:Rrf2 family protein
MITKTGIYGIRALLALANLPDGESAGAARVAEVVEVPQSYLSKLLQILVRDGLVNSQRGVGGGFQLARPAHAISLFDIVESLERIERWNGCFLGNAVCSDHSPCALHSRWKTVQQQYLEMLKETSLADLIRRDPLTEHELEQMLS